MSAEKPTAAFVLSLVGGLFVIFAGAAVALFFAALTFFVGGIAGVFGLLGIVWGVLIIVFAVQLYSNPSSHTTSGVLIIVFSVLSWVGSFGGFFIGFLLGLIGGILAIVWSPSSPAGTQPQPMQPTAPWTAQPGMKFCAVCGTQMATNAMFCPKCGAKQP